MGMCAVVVTTAGGITTMRVTVTIVPTAVTVNFTTDGIAHYTTDDGTGWVVVTLGNDFVTTFRFIYTLILRITAHSLSKCPEANQGQEDDGDKLVHN